MARKKRKRTYGTGSVYQRGKTFAIKWRDVNGDIRVKSGILTRELAEKALALVVGEVAAGKAGVPSESKNFQTMSALARDWLKSRESTHRSVYDDQSRWKLHLEPLIGTLRPDQITPIEVRRIVDKKLSEGLSPTTAQLIVRLLSTFMPDLVDKGLLTVNPCLGLSKATRRLMKPSYDPKAAPFVEDLNDVRRIYLALPAPISVAYAIGAFAGLRTGEIIGLRWEDVSLETRRIFVKQQFHLRKRVFTPLKDNEMRAVPIQDALLPVLRAWKETTGGKGLVCPPMRAARRRTSHEPVLNEHTLGSALRDVMKYLGLAPLTWYRATRHTFASQWVIGGGTLEQLRVVMGHEDMKTTLRYAHLRPDLYRQEDHARVRVSLAAPKTRDLRCSVCEGPRGPRRWVIADGKPAHASCVRAAA